MVEVSRNVVAILLLLVIVVSGLGTYSLVNREGADRATGYLPNTAGSPNGKVALQINDAPLAEGTVSITVEGANNG